MYKLQIRNEVNETEASEANSGDLYIYSSLEHNEALNGISAKSIIQEIANKDIHDITLHINSEGGDVFEALALYNWLNDAKNSHGLHVNAVVEGLCASSASIIAMAADNIIMHKNSVIMIHNPASFAMGTSEDFANISETLAMIADMIINIYSGKTGLSADTIKDLMNKESWLNADTCKSLGFCNEVIESKESNNAKPDTRAELVKKFMDSASISVNNMYKPVDKTDEAIKNMAGIINAKRGY